MKFLKGLAFFYLILLAIICFGCKESPNHQHNTYFKTNIEETIGWHDNESLYKTEEAYSGAYVCRTTKEVPYSVLFEIPLELLHDHLFNGKVSAYIRSNKQQPFCKLIIECLQNDTIILKNEFDATKKIVEKNAWYYFEGKFNLSEEIYNMPNIKFRFYGFNGSDAEVWFDDLAINFI